MSIFDSIKVPKPKRSNFDLSHDVKLTTDFGKLVPFLCTEVLPGDSFKCQSQVFARLAPMFAPVMNKMDIYTHYFFVPYRLLWDKWEDFITGGEDGLQMPSKPKKNLRDMAQDDLLDIGSLADYLGLPSVFKNKQGMDGEDIPNVEVDDLPFRAYALIWNEWYRDQNLQDEIPIDKDQSGTILGTPINQEGNHRYRIQHRCWPKDYFTSALPWPQRGPDMRLPMSEDPTITTDSKTSPLLNEHNGSNLFLGIGGTSGSVNVRYNGTLNRNELYVQGTNSDTSTAKVHLNPDQFRIDVSSLGPTVNELRRSIQIQKWLESNARGGARYIEQILSHFGVVSSDARLQRPELLGGGRSPVLISEVLNTAESSGGANDFNANLGAMGGHGVSAQNSHGFKRYFEEHGLLIGILSVMPRPSYYLGVPKLFSRFDKFDYAWPEFANLGEQEITLKELWAYERPTASTTKYDPDEVFGYTPRYAEYKMIPSQIHGEFRNSMRYWHLGRIFDGEPKLNAEFVTCGSWLNNTSSQEELDRIFAFQGDGSTYDDHIWIQVNNQIVAKRPLPYYGTPQF